MSSGCQGCNKSCERCQGCNSGCNTCQSFCEIGNQSVGGFSFNECVARGELLLHKTNWNRLLTYIRQAYTKGNLCDARGEYNLGRVYNELPNSDPNDVITAEVFNAISTALTSLTTSYNRLTVNIGDVIYGSYFETLQDYANRLQYKMLQCNVCNANCDANCNNSCNLCDAGSQIGHCCSSSCQTGCEHSPEPALGD